jgi:hypothetical protein
VAAERTETFTRASGTLTPVLGLGVAAALVVLGVVDRDGTPLWVPAAGVLLGVLVWTATLRPRVWVEPGTLVLRTMVETVRLPLAAVEEVAVRQVTAVRVGERRFVTSGAGRTMRQAMRGSPMQRARQHRGGVFGGVPGMGSLGGTDHPEVGTVYGDYVEERLRTLISQDRERRGVAAYSPRLEDIAEAEIRRERAWPEIVALAAAVVFLVVALLVG